MCQLKGYKVKMEPISRDEFVYYSDELTNLVIKPTRRGEETIYASVQVYENKLYSIHFYIESLLMVLIYICPETMEYVSRPRKKESDRLKDQNNKLKEMQALFKMQGDVKDHLDAEWTATTDINKIHAHLTALNIGTIMVDTPIELPSSLTSTFNFKKLQYPSKQEIKVLYNPSIDTSTKSITFKEEMVTYPYIVRKQTSLTMWDNDKEKFINVPAYFGKQSYFAPYPSMNAPRNVIRLYMQTQYMQKMEGKHQIYLAMKWLLPDIKEDDIPLLEPHRVLPIVVEDLVKTVQTISPFFQTIEDTTKAPLIKKVEFEDIFNFTHKGDRMASCKVCKTTIKWKLPIDDLLYCANFYCENSFYQKSIPNMTMAYVNMLAAAPGEIEVDHLNNRLEAGDNLITIIEGMKAEYNYQEYMLPETTEKQRKYNLRNYEMKHRIDKKLYNHTKIITVKRIVDDKDLIYKMIEIPKSKGYKNKEDETKVVSEEKESPKKEVIDKPKDTQNQTDKSISQVSKPKNKKNKNKNKVNKDEYYNYDYNQNFDVNNGYYNNDPYDNYHNAQNNNSQYYDYNDNYKAHTYNSANDYYHSEYDKFKNGNSHYNNYNHNWKK